MKQSHDIQTIVEILREEVRKFGLPIVTEVSRTRRDPFDVLITTILSLRTKDEVTREASRKLLNNRRTPEKLLELDESEIAEMIYPVGFYKTKAKTIRDVCRRLIDEYDSKVPDDLDELLKLKGVGRKTANLVITLGYGQLGVCVDTHVHRISNRLGYVKTKTPDETEMALRKKLPKEHWIEFNDLLVMWGQNICKPISPLCSQCRIRLHCMQVGVTRHR